MDGDQKAESEKFRSATPGEFIDKNDPPFFCYSGATDLIVPLNRTKPLHEQLKKNGVASEMHLVIGAAYGLAAINDSALSKAFHFLNQQLSD